MKCNSLKLIMFSIQITTFSGFLHLYHTQNWNQANNNVVKFMYSVECELSWKREYICAQEERRYCSKRKLFKMVKDRLAELQKVKFGLKNEYSIWIL